jgi:hypothetical protein
MDYARTVISHLCAERMHGRGYARHGDQRAAEYIRHEWEADGIQPLGDNFYQSFSVNVNTFPGSMKLKINGILLEPGRDYLIDPASPSLDGNFIPVRMSAAEALGGKSEWLLKSALNKVVLVDTRDLSPGKKEEKRQWVEWRNRQVFFNPNQLKAIVEITDDRLIFSTARQLSLIPHILIHAKDFPDSVVSMRANIRNCFRNGYGTQNIAGLIPGSVCTDSFLVYTAHYDHLGLMGRNTFFPGANDNASGVAMLLNLTRYFSAHPQRYSMVFICFAGEEAGLLGSEYFARNPLIRLSGVKFLINLDLVGTGIDGITVVNATEFPAQYSRLTGINALKLLVSEIKKRGAACNSDHCPFFQKGIPCFYIYTLGGPAAYHDLDDRPETLPLTAFEGLTKLLIEFTESF